MRRSWLIQFVTVVVPVAAWCDEIRPSFLMFSDPALQVPASRRLPDAELTALWRQALQRPEVDYQRLAAESITRAHQMGYPGVDVARPELLHVLTEKESHPIAVVAAALALIELNARDAAEPLFQTAQQRGGDVAFRIEPVLAKWRYEPAYSMWRARLGNADARRRELLLAVESAALVRDVEALPLLTEIVRAPDRPTDVRQAAARATGVIAESGLESLAAELTAGSSPPLVNRLCAVALLAQHKSEAVRSQLIGLARDPEPTVAAAALETLLAIDAQLVLPLAEEALQSQDAKVRSGGVSAYVALPSPERLERLTRVLHDPHPDVRGRAREGLFTHASQEEFNALIRNSATAVLAEEEWRGQEQAALLLAALDHKPAAPRLVELLESKKPQVMVAAAWGLRVLADPETIPSIMDKARRETEERSIARPEHFLAHDQLLAHLFEALARMNHTPARPIMQKYIPKSISMGDYSRGTAVWALGHLQNGYPDDTLAAVLMERAKDYGGMPPDTELVRRMSSISVGRMKAVSQLAECRKLMDEMPDGDIVDMALRWTIHELTGEDVPQPEPPLRTDGIWFLTPLSKKAN
jgi:HEAT repeat protein